MNELYKKVYIKTEKDLPKKTDKYIVHWKKDSDFDKINTVSWFTYEYLKESPECSVDNDYWLDYIDWYLQPTGGKSAMKELFKKIFAKLFGSKVYSLNNPNVSKANILVRSTLDEKGI